MDNRYNSCPPLMSDRREFTNYQGNRIWNQAIRNMNKIEDNHQYRLFLQSQGSEILSREREYNIKTKTCNIHGKCVNRK